MNEIHGFPATNTLVSIKWTIDDENMTYTVKLVKISSNYIRL